MLAPSAYCILQLVTCQISTSRRVCVFMRLCHIYFKTERPSQYFWIESFLSRFHYRVFKQILLPVNKTKASYRCLRPARFPDKQLTERILFCLNASCEVLWNNSPVTPHLPIIPTARIYSLWICITRLSGRVIQTRVGGK